MAVAMEQSTGRAPGRGVRSVAGWLVALEGVLLSTFLLGFGALAWAWDRWEGQMGVRWDSDGDDPAAVVFGLALAVLGLGMAMAAGRFVVRDRRRALGSLVGLAVWVAVAIAWAAHHGPEHRCATDGYSGRVLCISAQGAQQRDLVTAVAPVLVCLLAFWGTPRRRQIARHGQGGSRRSGWLLAVGLLPFAAAAAASLAGGLPALAAVVGALVVPPWWIGIAAARGRDPASLSNAARIQLAWARWVAAVLVPVLAWLASRAGGTMLWPTVPWVGLGFAGAVVIGATGLIRAADPPAPVPG